MDKIKIITPDKPLVEPSDRMWFKYEFVGPMPQTRYARQTAWKKRNPDKVRAYHRQYERDRRKALRNAVFSKE
jgi:hypothetical protein